MSKVSVFDQGWIDLVFEGRNKNYGAYQLRRDDPKTTIVALIAGISLMCTLVAIPVITNYFKDEVVIIDTPTLPEPTVVAADLEPLVVAPPKPEPAVTEPAGATTSSEPTVAFTQLVATSDPTPVDIPDTNTVLNTNAGSTTSPGDPNGTITGTAPTGTVPGTGTSVTPNEGTGGTIETFVDVAPQFPGGIQKFYDQVANKFRLPEVETSRSMKVYVSFVVEVDGSLTAIKATRDPGLGMGAEAVRVLKSITTKWKPGMKGGKAVRTAYNLPITINVH